MANSQEILARALVQRVQAVYAAEEEIEALVANTPQDEELLEQRQEWEDVEREADRKIGELLIDSGICWSHPYQIIRGICRREVWVYGTDIQVPRSLPQRLAREREAARQEIERVQYELDTLPEDVGAEVQDLQRKRDALMIEARSILHALHIDEVNDEQVFNVARLAAAELDLINMPDLVAYARMKGLNLWTASDEGLMNLVFTRGYRLMLAPEVFSETARRLNMEE